MTALAVAALGSFVVLPACGDPGALDRGDLRLPDRDPPAKTTTGSTQSNGDNDPTPGKRRKQAVAFIHGTSDHGNLPDLTCSGTGDEWRCVSATAVAEYWTQPTIDSERTASDGTTRRPYVVIGCPLSAQTPWPNATPVLPKGGAAEAGSAACVAAEVTTFLNGPDGAPNTDDDIDDVVLVTHSGGSNVVRYILQQHSARPEFGRMHAASRGFVGIAAPSEGTYLADRVFRFGVLSLGNKLFGAGYDDDGVDFIQTTKMKVWNHDPAKLANLDKDVAGVPSFMASGSFPDADGDEAKIACGGASETKGLHALHELYLAATDPDTFRDGCSDGFITCQSAMALANGDESRVVFGMLGKKDIGKTRFRAHNQSRRSCDDLDVDVRRTVNAILDGKAGKNLVASDSAPRAYRSLAASLADMTSAYGDVALSPRPSSASILARKRRDVVRVKVASHAPASSLRGVFRDPTGTIALAASFESTPDGSIEAVARVPGDAPAGGWTMHVAASDDDLAAHRDARLPVWVSSSTGAIDSASAERDDEGVIVHVRVRGARPNARLGARVTLVDETEAGAIIAGEGQASVTANASATTIDVYVPTAARAKTLVVRDVVLVSHDDASTLDVEDRVIIE